MEKSAVRPQSSPHRYMKTLADGASFQAVYSIQQIQSQLDVSVCILAFKGILRLQIRQQIHHFQMPRKQAGLRRQVIVQGFIQWGFLLVCAPIAFLSVLLPAVMQAVASRLTVSRVHRIYSAPSPVSRFSKLFMLFRLLVENTVPSGLADGKNPRSESPRWMCDTPFQPLGRT